MPINFELEISQAKDVIDRLLAERDDTTLAVINGEAGAEKKLRSLEADLTAAENRRDQYARAKTAHDRQEAELFAANKKRFRQSQLNVCVKHLGQIGPAAKEFEAAGAALDAAYRKLVRHCLDAEKSCPADVEWPLGNRQLAQDRITALAGAQLWRHASPVRPGGLEANEDQLALPAAAPAVLEQKANPTFGQPLAEYLAGEAASAAAIIKAKVERLK